MTVEAGSQENCHSSAIYRMVISLEISGLQIGDVTTITIEKKSEIWVYRWYYDETKEQLVKLENLGGASIDSIPINESIPSVMWELWMQWGKR